MQNSLYFLLYRFLKHHFLLSMVIISKQLERLTHRASQNKKTF
jgi:hypothetical protein